MEAEQVQSPPQTQPPYVPIRRTAWPTRRSPRLLWLAGAVVLVIAVAVALVHRPSQAERASDLRGFLQDMNTSIESCAGGVSESLTAMQGIESGASHDVADGAKVATDGATNCTLAYSMQIDDLTSYQVSQSLTSFNLNSVVQGLVTWADPDAVNVQTDIANVIRARTPPARARAQATLRSALRVLDAQRSAVDAVMEHAITSLSAHAAPPRLPG
jgi:hypothetical protein